VTHKDGPDGTRTHFGLVNQGLVKLLFAPKYVKVTYATFYPRETETVSLLFRNCIRANVY